MPFSDDVADKPANPLNSFDDFTRAVRARLDAGAKAYGDRSFQLSPDDLLAELGQEALDLAGWGFVLWSRIEGLRDELRRTEIRWGTATPDGAVRLVVPERETALGALRERA